MTIFNSGLLRAGLLSFTMLVPSASVALTISLEDDASALADALFLNLPGLTVNNGTNDDGELVTDVFGFSGQFGTYTNVTGTYGLPQNGIVLSSGNVLDYQIGGNNETGNSTSYGGFGGEGGGGDFEGVECGIDGELCQVSATLISGPGASNSASPNQEALLQPITGESSHNDVAQLNISFETAADVTQVTFFGAFGSEEWPEYVGDYVDGFGLYVNGTNYAGVNPFNSNTSLPVNIDHPSFAAIPGTELDGVLAPGGNPVLRFDVPVNPGTTNNFTIILADANDSVLDTTVYISSFIASNSGQGGGEPAAATGATEFDPLLPITNAAGETVFDENGGFIVDITEDLAASGQLIWVDPPVSVGFTYEVSGGALVTHITAPSSATVADLDGYILTINGVDYGLGGLANDAVFDIFDVLGLAGISSFTLTGIDTSLELDPTNPLAFPLGLNFANVTGNFQVSITPITQDIGNPSAVPLPATGLLYIGAVLMGGGLLRRRQKAA